MTNRTVSVENWRRIHLTARGLAGLEHQVSFLQLASFEPRIFNSQADHSTASELSFHFQSKVYKAVNFDPRFDQFFSPSKLATCGRPVHLGTSIDRLRGEIKRSLFLPRKGTSYTTSGHLQLDSGLPDRGDRAVLRERATTLVWDLPAKNRHFCHLQAFLCYLGTTLSPHWEQRKRARIEVKERYPWPRTVTSMFAMGFQKSTKRAQLYGRAHT